MLFSHAITAQNAFAQEHWVATWAASPQARAGGPARAPQATPAPAPPANPAQASSFKDQTVRMIVHTSIGGSRVRVELSNAYGTAALAIGAAHVALRASGGAIMPSSDRALTFGGKPSFSIPPGALAVSDPVNLAVPKLGDLAVSVYFPADTGPFTMHNTGLHTTYILAGDVAGVAAVRRCANHTLLVFSIERRCRRARRHGPDRGLRRFHHRWRDFHGGRRS